MLFAPYHAVVRVLVQKAFSDISRGRGSRAATQFASDAVFEFAGAHALGGERHGRAAVAAWFERFARLFPDLRITPLHIG